MKIRKGSTTGNLIHKFEKITLQEIELKELKLKEIQLKDLKLEKIDLKKLKRDEP